MSLNFRVKENHFLPDDAFVGLTAVLPEPLCPQSFFGYMSKVDDRLTDEYHQICCHDLVRAISKQGAEHGRFP